MSEIGLHAWVDESIHLDVPPAGLYILAAAVADLNADLDSARDTLRGIVVGPQPRLHWHSELDTTRAATVATIAKLDFIHVVVVRTAVEPRRQERARRKCLERLLFELSGLGVTQALLESRTEALNRRDIKLVDATRNSGAIDNLAVEFGRPKGEPLLWIPDAVAGAVALQRRDGDDRYRSVLASTIDEIDV